MTVLHFGPTEPAILRLADEVEQLRKRFEALTGTPGAPLPALVDEVVEGLIAFRDHLDGDADDEEEPDREILADPGDRLMRFDQDPDCELEDEHGGDINDVPHDPDPDEPTLGASEGINQEQTWKETGSHWNEEAETTAVERYGRGFLRSGPDDAEADEERSL